MIDWALRLSVKQAIQVYCFEEAELQLNTLSVQEWLDLADIRDFLQTFHDTTKATEGRLHGIDWVISIMNFLFNHYEKSMNKWSNNKAMKDHLETEWEKLKKYYKLTDSVPAYQAAIVLDFTQKWSYFEKNWADMHSEWISDAQRAVLDLWINDYKSTALSNLRQEIASDTTASDNEFLQYFNKRSTVRVDDEYQTYLRESILPSELIENPLQYWLESLQRKWFPNLSLMTLNILSISVMTADTEHLFSAAKLTVSSQRHCIDSTILELLQCLKGWNQSSLVTTRVTVSLLILVQIHH